MNTDALITFATVTNPQGNLADPDIKHYECSIHAAMEHFGIKEHSS